MQNTNTKCKYKIQNANTIFLILSNSQNSINYLYDTTFLLVPSN